MEYHGNRAFLGYPQLPPQNLDLLVARAVLVVVIQTDLTERNDAQPVEQRRKLYFEIVGGIGRAMRMHAGRRANRIALRGGDRSATVRKIFADSHHCRNACLPCSRDDFVTIRIEGGVVHVAVCVDHAVSGSSGSTRGKSGSPSSV